MPQEVATLPSDATAEYLQPTADINADLFFYTDTLGFRLDTIFPSEDPAVAVLSGFGLRIRLDRNCSSAAGIIHINTSRPASCSKLTAPNGTEIIIEETSDAPVIPDPQQGLTIRRLADGAPWVIGRAGMQYRDLIPDRLGGSIIASHIRIPDGGPVPDMVHFHNIGFQLIYCYRGWVRLVYEDQGPPFILNAGDCVTQPPRIRHRVLESSDQLEVIEIAVPAEHITTIDHELELPTAHYRPDRDFDGQVFCRHELAYANWRPWRVSGFESRDTGVEKCTVGAASVHVARRMPDVPTQPGTHAADILFTFVAQGSLTLEAIGHDSRELVTGDAFVLPPHLQTHYTNCSDDLELLEVSLAPDVTALAS